jgi:hypothetical protein
MTADTHLGEWVPWDAGTASFWRVQASSVFRRAPWGDGPDGTARCGGPHVPRRLGPAWLAAAVRRPPPPPRFCFGGSSATAPGPGPGQGPGPGPSLAQGLIREQGPVSQSLASNASTSVFSVGSPGWWPAQPTSSVGGGCSGGNAMPVAPVSQNPAAGALDALVLVASLDPLRYAEPEFPAVGGIPDKSGWFLTSLCGTGAYRGQAAFLVGAVQARAREQGVDYLLLSVDAARPRLVGMYRELGFAEVASTRAVFYDPVTGLCGGRGRTGLDSAKTQGPRPGPGPVQGPELLYMRKPLAEVLTRPSCPLQLFSAVASKSAVPASPGSGAGLGPWPGPVVAERVRTWAEMGPGMGTGIGTGMGPGMGPGPGTGPGPGVGPGTGMRPGTGPGTGPGMGPGTGTGMGTGMGPGPGTDAIAALCSPAAELDKSDRSGLSLKKKRRQEKEKGEKKRGRGAAKQSGEPAPLRKSDLAAQQMYSHYRAHHLSPELMGSPYGPEPPQCVAPREISAVAAPGGVPGGRTAIAAATAIATATTTTTVRPASSASTPTTSTTTIVHPAPIHTTTTTTATTVSPAASHTTITTTVVRPAPSHTTSTTTVVRPASSHIATTTTIVRPTSSTSTAGPASRTSVPISTAAVAYGPAPTGSEFGSEFGSGARSAALAFLGTWADLLRRWFPTCPQGVLDVYENGLRAQPNLSFAQFARRTLALLVLLTSQA